MYSFQNCQHKKQSANAQQKLSPNTQTAFQNMAHDNEFHGSLSMLSCNGFDNVTQFNHETNMYEKWKWKPQYIPYTI